MRIERELHYDDVYLIPQKSILKSRSEADVTMKLGKHTFGLPVIPANMKAVVDANTCEYLASKNIFYIMHRICEYEEIYNFVKSMNSKNLITSISVGVNQVDMDLLKRCHSEGLTIDYITIDIAHAHSNFTMDMVEYINSLYFDSYLIVGNVATGDAVQFFEKRKERDYKKYKIDAVKSGISCGEACSTKNMTGFNRRMISTLLDCDSKAYSLDIIADGGIKENGDYAKALNCGKRIVGVMAGSCFAGFEESAGKVLTIEKRKVKEYYGNASKQAKNGSNKHVEGITTLVDYKGSMDFYLQELKMSLQSSVSYAGKSKIKHLYGIPMTQFK